LCIPHLQLHTHGQVLAYFAFFAGITSGLLTNSKRNTLAPAVREFFNFLHRMFDVLRYAPSPAISFPTTFISLMSSVPETNYLIPPEEFVPLLHPLGGKTVDQLALINFSEKADRDFCNRYFSQGTQ